MFPRAAPVLARMGKQVHRPDGPTTGLLTRGHVRRQSAALPLYNTADGPRLVLITSRETRRWVVPKGWIEPWEAPHRSAGREAFEEAGLAGEAEAMPLGRYEYAKRLGKGVLLPTEVLVFRFRVTALLEQWPEKRERERRLFTPEEAAGLVAEPELARLIAGLSPG
jgi:8-oxo-dGTP pyrophosphatase MutT (NUDIX family)